MSMYVFLGPTLAVAEAKKLCRARYLPPVRMGDVVALVRRKASVIAIIDGTFQNAPAVWHKEILHAIDRGVRVFGCSSMGALRAAELYPFGVEGSGAIYEAFRDGVYEDDDEVAVAHAGREHGYRPLSEALVNIRAALCDARRRELISEVSEAALVRHAKATFYPDRGWPVLFAAARELGVPAHEVNALHAFVRAEQPNAKRDDAVELLRMLGRSSTALAPATKPKALVFERTWFWNQMLVMEGRRRRWRKH
jgi:hypothetical protein